MPPDVFPMGVPCISILMMNRLYYQIDWIDIESVGALYTLLSLNYTTKFMTIDLNGEIDVILTSDAGQMRQVASTSGQLKTDGRRTGMVVIRNSAFYCQHVSRETALEVAFIDIALNM